MDRAGPLRGDWARRKSHARIAHRLQLDACRTLIVTRPPKIPFPPRMSTSRRTATCTGYHGKRALDVALVAFLGPLWIPLLGLTALFVRLFIGSPILFRQRRPGMGERPFDLVKFRTMTDQRDPDGQLRPDAERLTRFGRFLRSTSLDELPELLNVLRGEMSLVGPRPLLPQYLSLYSPRHRRRHEVRPGLTGLAQASGRNALTWAERLELDVAYVDQISLVLDLRILCQTLKAVVTREGIAAAGDATMPAFTGYDLPPHSPRTPEVPPE